MKKNRIIVPLSLLLTAVSCEEYLNVKPRGYDVASTLNQYAGLLYGMDRAFLKESFPRMCFETYTDQDGYALAYSSLDGQPSTAAYKWQENIYREDETCGEWNCLTANLYSYNKVIDEVMSAEDGTQEEKLAIQSEARMMRAWSIFMMSQFFGDVPLITKASTMDNDLPLKSYGEVKSFVISEMEQAVTHLASEKEHYLRVFSLSGHGLFGKVLFMYGEYEKASVELSLAFDAMKSSPETKLINYRDYVDESGNLKEITNMNQNPEKLFYLLWFDA